MSNLGEEDSHEGDAIDYDEHAAAIAVLEAERDAAVAELAPSRDIVVAVIHRLGLATELDGNSLANVQTRVSAHLDGLYEEHTALRAEVALRHERHPSVRAGADLRDAPCACGAAFADECEGLALLLGLQYGDPK